MLNRGDTPPHSTPADRLLISGTSATGDDNEMGDEAAAAHEESEEAAAPEKKAKKARKPRSDKQRAERKAKNAERHAVRFG